MRLLCLFLALSFANTICSQHYIKIPTDSNHYWRQRSFTYEYQIKYKKDTLIAGKVYNKYSQFGDSYGGPYFQTFQPNGYLRQDSLNQTVFILGTDFTERRIYDFKKVVGDTLLMYRAPIISTSTLVCTVTTAGLVSFNDGINRKFQQLTDEVGFANIVVEGIGSIKGGLFGNFPVNDESTIECFGTINPPLASYKRYPDSDCYLIYTGIKNYSDAENDIKLYPNPTNDKLHLEFSKTDPGNLKLSITNTLGQTVLNTNAQLSNSKAELDLSSLPAGIYYLKSESKTGYKVFKIVKE